MAKNPKIIYDCENLTVQDLIDFCKKHNLPLNTKLNLAGGLTELCLEPFTELAIVKKEIVLYSY